jgi:hypothetical protein
MLVDNQNIFDAGSTDEATDTDTEAAASSTENEETSTVSDGSVEEAPKDLNDKTPLHKDARFKRVIEERNRERAEKRELMERLERLEKQQRPDSQQKQGSSKPAWFAKYFGDDEEAWDGFKQMTASAKEEAKAEAVAELKREQEMTSKETQKWEQINNERMDELEEDGESFDRNALMKLLVQRPIYDPEGNLDFRTGLELLRMKNPKNDTVSAKREAGAKATGSSKSGAEPKKKSGLTSEDIRKMRMAEGW